MPLRKIAQLGEPILRRRAEEVPPGEIGSPRVQALIDDLIVTMRDVHGAGLAAPQIYESSRVCVIEVRENPRYPDFAEIPLMVLINPVLTPLVDSPLDRLLDRDSISLYEGCLSVRGLRGRVRRPRKVRVQGLDRNGHGLDFTWEGVPAAVVQHETDHLDGVLFVDRADPKTLCFLDEFARYVPTEERIVDGR